MNDMPNLQELNVRLQQLEASITGFEQNRIIPLKKESEEADERIAAVKQEFEEIVAKLREEAVGKISGDEELKQNNYKAIREAEKELQLLKDQLRIAQQDHALALQALAAQQKLQELEERLLPLLDSVPGWSKAMDFQRDDIFFQLAAYETGKSGVLNANEMGLGKTIETAILDASLLQLFAKEHDRLPRCIWLTKKSLVKSSANEIKKWNPDRVIIPILSGTPEQRKFMVELALQNNALIIANYEAVGTTPLLQDIDFDFVYIDEVHRLKGGANSKPTALWTNAKKVCDKASFKVFLSGSPIVNHWREMWAYLHLFRPDMFPTLRKFEREFTTWQGTVDVERLIRIMKDQTVRRRKDEVQMQLPDLTREFRYVEMSGRQEELYNQMKSEFFVWLDDQKENGLSATAIIAQLTRLRQIALVPSGVKITHADKSFTQLDCTESAKLDEAMEIIEELHGQNQQVVVFSSQFNEPLYELRRRCNAVGISCTVLDGASVSRTGEIEEEFQQGRVDVLAINMKTGSEGLNLQKNPDYWPGGANEAIFLDLWYAPATNEQAEARIHRKGQTHAVTIHIIQAENSVDAFIAAILEEKEAMIKGIVERDELRKGSDWKEMLSELL